MPTCWSCNKEIAEGSSTCPHCRVPVTREAVDAMATIGPGGVPSVQIVPGSIVGSRYEVRREIGRGGMGIVYLAFDRTMELEVALKVIPQELCMDPRAIADLKRETSIALKLTHPHIMRLYTLDTWEGQAFVVMEYVDGGTLAHLLAEKQRLSLDEALPLLQQIASALDYSHTASPAVIHRDLKPLNILLTDQGQIKVADFGLARVLRDSASRVSGSDSAGTLAYMAPEQIRGKGIGRHTDIYALAAINYEMLAGHPPYYTGDLRWQIMHEDPDPISDQPDYINQVLLTGLAKEIEARPASAGELIQRLAAGGDERVVMSPQQEPEAEAVEFPLESTKEVFTSIVPEPPFEQPAVVKKGLPMEWLLGGLMIVLVIVLASGEITKKIRGIRVKPTSDHAMMQEPAKKQAAGESSSTPSVSRLGGLKIISVPYGAEVYVDGSRSGTTPLNIHDLQPAKYQVVVETDGYELSSRIIEVTAGETAISTFILKEKVQPGRLTINATPQDAKIRILNIKPAYYNGIELKPGRYHVEVSKSGYKTVKGWVELESGGDLQVKTDLEKITGEKVSVSQSNVFGRSYTDPTTGMEFVYVKGGCFQMGDTSRKPMYDLTPHKACVDDYYIGKYEVTVKQYKAVMGNTRDKDGHPFLFNGDNQPVHPVSWDQAREFISKLNSMSRREYRLPTEAEWEYAARGRGEKYQFSGSNNIEEVAWYKGNSKTTNGHNCDTHPVGTKKPNSLGIYDMTGNVDEWCYDRFDMYYYRKNPPVNNPTGPTTGSKRVKRGGDYCDPDLIMNVWDRSGFRANGAAGGFGYRLAFTRKS